MAKKTQSKNKPRCPKSFAGLIRGRSKQVRDLAQNIRGLVFDEVVDVQESFCGATHAMAMYRSQAEICWVQPLKECCNIYFVRGPELSDNDAVMLGESDRYRYVKVRNDEELESLPIRAWIQQTLELNLESDGLSFDDVLERVRDICLVWPHTKETLTWGRPHFRVGEKIFCGCGETHGRPSLGFKMEPHESRMFMKLPGCEKAPYSRPNDGWVSIDPNTFDDWDEIERLILGSYRLIAPKKILAELDGDELPRSAKRVRHKKTGRSP